MPHVHLAERVVLLPDDVLPLRISVFQVRDVIEPAALQMREPRKRLRTVWFADFKNAATAPDMTS